jgi:hypothetical protein
MNERTQKTLLILLSITTLVLLLISTYLGYLVLSNNLVEEDTETISQEEVVTEETEDILTESYKGDYLIAQLPEGWSIEETYHYDGRSLSFEIFKDDEKVFYIKNYDECGMGIDSCSEEPDINEYSEFVWFNTKVRRDDTVLYTSKEDETFEYRCLPECTTFTGLTSEEASSLHIMGFQYEYFTEDEDDLEILDAIFESMEVR